MNTDEPERLNETECSQEEFVAIDRWVRERAERRLDEWRAREENLKNEVSKKLVQGELL